MTGSSNDSAAGDPRLRHKLTPVFRILDGVTLGAFQASALTLLAITMLYCMEIVLRYAFGSPTLWSRDTITYLLCGMLMLAAPQVARRNTHVAITIFVDSLPDRIRGAVESTLALSTAIISGGVAWITAQETIRLMTSNILTLGTIAIPKWWISAFIPIGFALVSLQFLSFALDRSRMGQDRTQV